MSRQRADWPAIVAGAAVVLLAGATVVLRGQAVADGYVIASARAELRALDRRSRSLAHGLLAAFAGLPDEPAGQGPRDGEWLR